MGMFGSLGKFIGGLNTPGDDGISNVDRLGNLAAAFSDDDDAFAESQKALAARRAAYGKAQAQESMTKKLLGMLGPQFQNAPDISVGMPAPVAGAGMPDAVNLMSKDTAPPPMPANLPETFLPRKTSDGLNINSPELPGLVVKAEQAGLGDAVGKVLDVLKAQKPAEPKYFEGPDGIYREEPDHSFKRRQDYPAGAPPGFRVSADGKSLEYIPNGPADPAYIARTAGVRRDAVTSRPMPGRGGGSHPGFTGLPAGFRVNP